MAPKIRPIFLDNKTPPSFSTLVVMASMTALSMNIFVPSLPSMAIWFNTDYSVMQLMVAGFLATNAVAQLFVGPLSDRYGRRPVLITGLSIYLLATLGCIFAANVATLLAFRVLQSAVVVGMVLSRTIVRDIYEKDEAASVIGYVVMGMAVVPMFAPAIGGFVDEAFGWQANFWVMFLTGLVMLALLIFDTGETNAAKSASFIAQFKGYPELLLSRRFWGYSFTAALSSGAFFAYLGGGPFVGTVVYGLSPATLGMLFGAPSLGYFIGNGITGRYAARVGTGPLMITGSLLAFSGPAISLLTEIAGLSSPATFFSFMTLVGLGNGLVLPNASASLLSVRPNLAGTASGLGSSLMIAGGAALSALAGSLLGPTSGAAPLLIIMTTVTGAGIVITVLTVRRERRIELAQ